jgi:hypothetical protein
MEIEQLKMAVSDGDGISAAIFKTLQGIALNYKLTLTLFKY